MEWLYGFRVDNLFLKKNVQCDLIEFGPSNPKLSDILLRWVWIKKYIPIVLDKKI